MIIKENEKAKVLAKALPYIKQYSGKTFVVKYGGNAMINENLKNAVMSDLVLLSLVGINVVMVHGGGPEISEVLTKMNIESTFKNGLRVTDSQTMDVVQMVLAGKLNKNLVSLINRQGGKAVGLCGLDSKMITAEKLNGPDDLGFVGEVTDINTKIITDMINLNYIPVIATVGEDTDGNAYNINADIAAAAIAGRLKAEKLILMTDIKGLLRDINDENSLISVLGVSEVNALKLEGVINGGMIPKIDCCVEAVRRGVHRAHIIDGRNKHSLLMEILSDEGIGTMIL